MAGEAVTVKRLIGLGVLLAIVLVFSGCSTSEQPKNSLTLDTFIKAYTDAGVKVDPNEKQMYQMAGAEDGVIFYMDNMPVKIYKYKSEKDLKDAVKKDEMLKDWPSNGNFLLETNSEKAKEIFGKVK